MFWSVLDARFEDCQKIGLKQAAIRDAIAGISVAITALPLNLGFAVASGQPPASGIIGASIAALLSALFGGSKYAVAGPAAPLIPVLAGLIIASVIPMWQYARSHHICQ